MSPSSSVFREDLRQLEHLLPVSFAFLLKYLDWQQALLLALLAILYALFISPRIFPSTQRPDELRKRLFTGKAVYAFSVFLLILFFRDADYIVAIIWANLSVGDAASNVFGRRYGRSALPWNRHKTWVGTASAIFCSSVVSFILVLWTGIPSVGLPVWKPALLYSVSTSAVCSMAESLPLPMDDNFTICIAGAAFMAWVPHAQWAVGWDRKRAIVGIIVSFALGIIAYALKTVTFMGFLLGGVFGVLVYAAFGAPGFLLLGTFFVLGSVFTRLGFRSKEQSGRAEANAGQRSAYHVVGKGLAGLLAAAASLFLADKTHITVGFTAAIAAALFDTTATELGQLLGRKYVLLRSFEQVPRGTPGAVSAEGSLAGLTGAAIIALEAVAFDLIGWWACLCVLTSASIAVHLESYWAAGAGTRVSGRILNATHTTLAMLLAMVLVNLGA